MEFRIEQIEEPFRKSFEEILAEQGEKTGSSGTLIKVIRSRENAASAGYDGSKDVLTLTGKGAAQWFCGLFLFLQAVRAEEIHRGEIWQKKVEAGFEKMAVMFDCSRNGALTVCQIKKRIRRMAALGLNQIMLYLEDLYTIDENPYFGAFRGRYTKDELRELADYAYRYGLELIPCIQTLAHLNTFLRWPAQDSLKDIRDILLVGDENVNALIGQMISNIMEPLRTKKIHLGMDEAELLGYGRYLYKNGYTKPFEIMKQHLELVNDICRQKGYEPMIWSDMYVKLMSPTGGYYDLPKEEEVKVTAEIPEGLGLVYWDYYHHTEEEYLENIRFHQKFLSENVILAAGGWTWNGIAPNYAKAAATMERGLRAGRSLGISRVICTLWYDNGAETPMETDLYAMVLFAQNCYGKWEGDGQEAGSQKACSQKACSQEAGNQEADRWLRQFGGLQAQDFMLLDAFDRVPGVTAENKEAANPSKYLLYQDVLLGLFDRQIEGMELDSYYGGLEKKLDEVCLRTEKLGETPDAKELRQVFQYYRKLAGLLARKAELGLQLQKCYKEYQCWKDSEGYKDSEGNKSAEGCEGNKGCKAGAPEGLVNCLETIRECRKMCLELKEMRESIWMEECRPFGYEVLDIRLGGVATRLASAEGRIRKYLDGEIDSLPELEEERLFYHPVSDEGEPRLRSCNLWERIVSAGNMCEV